MARAVSQAKEIKVLTIFQNIGTRLCCHAFNTVITTGADSHRVFGHILALPQIQAAWGRVYLASPLGRHLKSEVTNLDFLADVSIVSRCPRSSELTPVDRRIKRPLVLLDD